MLVAKATSTALSSSKVMDRRCFGLSDFVRAHPRRQFDGLVIDGARLEERVGRVQARTLAVLLQAGADFVLGDTPGAAESRRLLK